MSLYRWLIPLRAQKTLTKVNPTALLPIGTIVAYGTETAPTGWLACDGANLLRTDHQILFNVIGTVHGTADGTHFNVPDLRGKFLRGFDDSAGNDPNAGARTAPTGGASGDNVGSLQVEGILAHVHAMAHTHTIAHTHTMAHTHNYDKINTVGSLGFASSGIFGSGYVATATTAVSTPNTGGSSAGSSGGVSTGNTSNNTGAAGDTRRINAGMQFIIFRG